MSETDNSSDPWVTRVGIRAARARRSSVGLRPVAIGLLLLVPIAVVAIVILFVTQNGNPTVPEVATAAVIGVLGGLVGAGLLSASTDQHNQAIDHTVAYLRKQYPDVTAADAHELLASSAAFDAGMSGRVPSPVLADAPKTMTWTPDIARPILPGVTEAGLVSIHRAIAAVGIAGVIVLAGLGAIHRFPPMRVWYSGWAVVVGVLAISFAFWLAAIARGRREFQAGYTTSPTGTQLVGRGQTRPVDAHTSLDFVDGKTGFLLRHSNAVLLSRAVYQQRLAQIRAAHPGARPTRLPTP